MYHILLQQHKTIIYEKMGCLALLFQTKRSVSLSLFFLAFAAIWQMAFPKSMRSERAP